jgi:hypothetical protein
MQPEIRLIIDIVIFMGIWMYLDSRLCKSVGMSPIFGALLEKNLSNRVRGFSFTVGLYILIIAVADYFLRKVTGHLPIGLSVLIFSIYTGILVVLATLISRIAISIHIRKEDDGKALVINGIIGCVILFFIIIALLYGFVF